MNQIELASDSKANGLRWRKAKDSIGETYGRLLVVSLDRCRARKITFAVCRCVCGSEHRCALGNLRNGTATSCGCLRREVPNHVTHGLSNAPEYSCWKGMIDRCHNPNHTAFRHYGGRGISVCSRWRDSVEAFIEDMEARPKGKSIDRIDNDLGYYKENCRWATARQQGQNRRGLVLTRELADRIRSLRASGMHRTAIARKLGLAVSSVSSVLYQGCWS